MSLKATSIIFLGFTFFCFTITYGQNIRMWNIDSVKCRNLSGAKLSKEEIARIKSRISKMTDIKAANDTIRKIFCLTNSDRYSLVCRNCNPICIRSPLEQFPSNSVKSNSLSSKVDNNLYTLIQLKQLLSLKIAVFDSIVFDISELSAIDKVKAQTLYFKNAESLNTIQPYYDNLTNHIILRKNQFTQYDLFPLTAFYSENNEEIPLHTSFKLHFISDIEKEEILDIITDLRKTDPSIFEDTSAYEYIEELIPYFEFSKSTTKKGQLAIKNMKL